MAKKIEIGRGDTQSYVLSLEDIELSYLSKYVRSSKKKVPLWSKKQLDGELEYFEIKITPQEFDEDDCYHEPSDTYKCHICNIDVPTMFFKEHNASLEHKKMKNIFDKVLKRVCKHIDQNIDYKDHNQEVYYCEPCSKTIKRKNKYKHEATDFHKKSQKNIEILNKFHDLFTENDVLSFSVNDEDAQNSIEDENVEEVIRIDTPPPPPPEPDNLDFNDLTITPTVSEKDKIPFEVYLRNVKSKYNQLIDLPEVEGEYVYFVNTTGMKVKIPQTHYQGYRIVGNLLIHCILCHKWLEDITAHDQEESHVRNMFKPIDENFSRACTEVISNCLVCNEFTFFKSDHWISNQHTTALQNMIVVQPSQPKVVTKGKITLCSSCNVYINKKKILRHRNTKKHKYLRDRVNSNAHITSENPFSKYYCTVCKVNVPEGGREIHEKGKRHTANIPERPKNVAQSRPSVAINPYSEATPSTSFAHSTVPNPDTPQFDDKVDYYEKLLKVSEVAGEYKAICNVCDVLVPYERQNIIDHMEGYLHKQEVDAFKTLLELIDETRVRCKICNVSINYVERTITEHMIGQLHRATELKYLKFHTVKKQNHAYFCNCCNERFKNYFDHINSDSHIKIYQYEITIDQDLMRKYVYDLNVNRGLGLMYQELYKNLLRVNNIHKIDKKFVCNYCFKEIGRTSEIRHMLGERHRQCVESAEESDE